MATTWNPADKSANFTLSNGNLTATVAVNGSNVVRATSGKSSGKWYFELLFNVTNTITFGVAQSTHALTAYIGATSDGWGWGDSLKTNGTNEGDWGYDPSVGSVVMCAVDMDVGEIWWGVDGVWFESGNPATGTNPAFSNLSGTVYPAASLYYATNAVTARFDLGSFSYTPPSGFSAFDNDVQHELPAETLAFTGYPLTQTTAPLYQLIPTETLTWAAQNPSQARAHTLPAATLTWAARALQQTYDAPSYAIARAVYRCYLTGDAEDPPVADLELPLASFQSRRRNGTQTYLAITVPNPVPYIDAINTRLNGDIVIYSGFSIGATETLTELLRVNFGSFRYDLGARSGTASLSGHKQVTYSNPKTRALSGISYQSVTDGVNLVRCEPDMWLNPGDTADIGDSTFIVDTITYIVQPTLAYMEVQEVAA